MANVRWLLGAEEDLEGAMAWYESRSHPAARRFEQEVAAAVERLTSLPEMYALVDERYRYCPLRKSQYVLIYRYDSAIDTVVVAAVTHTKKRPPSWLSLT